MTTAVAGEVPTAIVSDYWLARRDRLFIASCVALIVTAMSFAIRGDITNTISTQFRLDKTQLGWIDLNAFWGFTLAMIVGGPLCDILGMRTLLLFAFIGHALGIVVFIFSTTFWSFFVGMLFIGLANGFVEAACNPLLATLYPDQKIKRLNHFHAWFPGGIVIGGLIAYAITRSNLGGDLHGWQIKLAAMLVPLVVYGYLFIGQKFPATERAASGVSTSKMWTSCLHPFFLLFVVCMLMTAVTELGPGQWIPSILTLTVGIPGILVLVWINGLMSVGRNFAGPIVHRMSPVAMLTCSSAFAAVGLYLLSLAHAPGMAIFAATLFAIGVCFYWPTMLGVVNERFPMTGALGLAVMGGAGNLSSGFIQPIIGHTIDTVAAQGTAAAKLQHLTGAAFAQAQAHAQAAGSAAALQQVVVFPVILVVIFGAIYLFDKSRGGYRKEILTQDQRVPSEAVVR